MRLIDADKLPRTQIVERRRVVREGRLRMEHRYVTVIKARDVDAAETVSTCLEWIPVTDRLPRESMCTDDFFLVNVTGIVQGQPCHWFTLSATYCGGGRWELPFAPYEDISKVVTHWMYLPDMPKEDV